MGDRSAIFVEAGEGMFGVGSWYESAENVVTVVAYRHVGGYAYPWYGWE